MNEKYKLTFDEMIQHLLTKNVQFNIISETEAIEILRTRNYYYKLTSYKHNYRKEFDKIPEGIYTHLEFAYLVDLAAIDMKLRYILIQMCLDLEHAIKVRILEDITDDDTQDGFQIVLDYLDTIPTTVEKYIGKMGSYTSYAKKMYDRHHQKLPIWVFMECVSFGQFVRFVEYYYLQNKKNDAYYKKLNIGLKHIKNIRNAAAHSTPILMNIAEPGRSKKTELASDFLLQVHTIGRDVRNKKLKNHRVHDLVLLLFIYEEYITSSGMKKHTFSDLFSLLQRCKRNKSYYEKNLALISTFTFFEKIIIHLDEK